MRACADVDGRRDNGAIDHRRTFSALWTPLDEMQTAITMAETHSVTNGGESGGRSGSVPSHDEPENRNNEKQNKYRWFREQSPEIPASENQPAGSVPAGRQLRQENPSRATRAWKETGLSLPDSHPSSIPELDRTSLAGLARSGSTLLKCGRCERRSLHRCADDCSACVLVRSAPRSCNPAELRNHSRETATYCKS